MAESKVRHPGSLQRRRPQGLVRRAGAHRLREELVSPWLHADPVIALWPLVEASVPPWPRVGQLAVRQQRVEVVAGLWPQAERSVELVPRPHVPLVCLELPRQPVMAQGWA